MKISEVKTAFKIADVIYTQGQTKLEFRYLNPLKDENGNELPQSLLKQNLARVYLVVVDGEIKKIGGSQARGGIKSTLNIYMDGGIGGRPSVRSFGVWYFLYHTILQKKKVEFWMIYQENFEKEIKGLFGYNLVKNAYISYKLLEECCIADYRARHDGAFPEWNIQEQGADWPDDVKTRHADITTASTRTSRSRRPKISLKNE